MQFLTALLAFAAVMALLSTIVAVAIEAYIASRGMRLTGLQRLLQNYYRDAVVPRLPGETPTDSEISREARAFAADMVANPARLGRSGRGGGGRYRSLTTRQLVEQLARTTAGATLLQLDDADLRPRLEALAYEFDRLGDGARAFFTRRTGIFAVLLAMVMAFSLNVDALRLYKVMATDVTTRETLIRWADEQITRDDPSGPTEDPSTELSRLVALLGTMNIPVGYSQYPFCLRYSAIHGDVTEQSPVFDPRCGQAAQRLARLRSGQPASLTPQLPAMIRPVGDMISGGLDVLPPLLRSRLHFDSWVWLFSTLVAGGMIGLGAPFWFNVYRRLASLIPVVGAASAVAATLRGQPRADSQAAPPPQGRRDTDEVRGADIVVAARTAAGQSPVVPDAAVPGTAVPAAAPAGAPAAAPNITGHSPPGTSIGAGSAQRVAAATASGGTGGETGFRMRRLRG